MWNELEPLKPKCSSAMETYLCLDGEATPYHYAATKIVHVVTFSVLVSLKQKKRFYWSFCIFYLSTVIEAILFFMKRADMSYPQGPVSYGL